MLDNTLNTFKGRLRYPTASWHPSRMNLVHAV